MAEDRSQHRHDGQRRPRGFCVFAVLVYEPFYVDETPSSTQGREYQLERSPFDREEELEIRSSLISVPSPSSPTLPISLLHDELVSSRVSAELESLRRREVTAYSPTSLPPRRCRVRPGLLLLFLAVASLTTVTVVFATSNAPRLAQLQRELMQDASPIPFTPSYFSHPAPPASAFTEVDGLLYYSTSGSPISVEFPPSPRVLDERQRPPPFRTYSLGGAATPPPLPPWYDPDSQFKKGRPRWIGSVSVQAVDEDTSDASGGEMRIVDEGEDEVDDAEEDGRTLEETEVQIWEEDEDEDEDDDEEGDEEDTIQALTEEERSYLTSEELEMVDEIEAEYAERQGLQDAEDSESRMSRRRIVMSGESGTSPPRSSHVCITTLTTVSARPQRYLGISEIEEASASLLGSSPPRLAPYLLPRRASGKDVEGSRGEAEQDARAGSAGVSAST